MPLRLSDFKKDTKDATISFDGIDSVLNVTYRSRSWTPRNEAAYRDLMDQNRPSEGLVALVLAQVTAWDLQTEDGTPVPLTKDALTDVYTTVLNKVIAAITKDMQATSTDPN